MIVKRISYTEGIDNFLTNLDETTVKLEEINDKRGVISQKELKGLTTLLHRCNETLEGSLGEKKFVPEGMNASIEKALQAVLLFQITKEKAMQRNVDQAISVIVSSLNRELKQFNKNLKKFRIGRKTEKTNPSKQS